MSEGSGRTYIALCSYMNMVYSACRLPVWGFGRDGTLYTTTCPLGDALGEYLAESGNLSYCLSPERLRDRPLLFSDDLGLVWCADYVCEGDALILLVLAGPVFVSASSAGSFAAALKESGISVRLRAGLAAAPRELPVMDMGTFEQYTIMLHSCIRGEPLADYSREIRGSTDCISPGEGAALREADAAGAHLEEQIFGTVKSGGTQLPEGTRRLKAAGLGGLFPAGTGKPGRDERDGTIVLAALCSRAAAEANVDPGTAAAMRTEFIRRIEEAEKVTDLMALGEEIIRTFGEKVRISGEEAKNLSGPILACCEYVRRNLRRDVPLEEIADALGYTAYYLTRKFRSEMGISLKDWAKRERIGLAKVYLLTTSLDIQEISEALGFGSRSGFSRVFREVMGTTPSAFRERAGKLAAGEQADSSEKK